MERVVTIRTCRGYERYVLVDGALMELRDLLYEASRRVEEGPVCMELGRGITAGSARGWRRWGNEVQNLRPRRG
jgi:hypothetical protein